MPSPAPPSTTTWTGSAGDGLWSNAANWTNGVPSDPSALTADQQDVATIRNPPGTVIVAGNQFVQDLTLDATAAVAGPALALQGTLDTAFNRMADGSFGIGSVVLQAGGFEIDGGLLRDTQIVQAGGTLTFGSQALFGQARLSLDFVDGVLAVGGNSDVVSVQGGYVYLTNGAGAVITGASTLDLQGDLYTAGTVQIASGVLLLDGGSVVDEGQSDTIVENGGTLIDAAGGSLTDTTIDGDWTISAAGQIVIQPGKTATFEKAAGATPVSVTAAANAVLDLQGSLDLLGSLSLAGGSVVYLEGAIQGGTLAGAGIVEVDPQSGPATLSNATIDATVILAGTPAPTLVVTGTSQFGLGSVDRAIDLQGGTLEVSGTLTLDGVSVTNGTLLIDAGAALLQENGTTIDGSVTTIDRSTFATAWTGAAGDGLWSDAANWSHGLPVDPSALIVDGHDVATIDDAVATTPYTVTIDGSERGQDLVVNATDPFGAPAVSLTGTLDLHYGHIGGGLSYGALTLDRGSFEIDGGTLALAFVTEAGGQVVFGAGVDTLDNAVIYGNVLISNGSDVVLTGPGVAFFGDAGETTRIDQSSTLSVQSDFQTNGTVIIASGVVSLDGGGLSEAAGGRATIIEAGGTLLDTASAQFDNVTIDGDWAVAGGATITVDAGKTVILDKSAGAVPVAVRLGPGATLDVAGTLDLFGALLASAGTVRLEDTLQGAAITGSLLVDPASLATIDNVSVSGNVTFAAGTTLLANGTDVLGSDANTTVDLGGGTLDVAGTLSLRGLTLENGTVTVEAEGVLSADAGTVFQGVTSSINPAMPGTTTLVNQDVTLDLGLLLVQGETLLAETGRDAQGRPTGSPGYLLVTQNGFVGGSGLVQVSDANGPPSLVLNGGLAADIPGQTLRVLTTSFSGYGSLSALSGGTLEIGDPTQPVASGQATGIMVVHGLYTVGQGSAIILDNQGPITSLLNGLTLDGPGSELYAGNGGTLTPLESSLVNIGDAPAGQYGQVAGSLNLLDGRGFGAAHALTNIGFITLQGGTLSAPSITGAFNYGLGGFGAGYNGYILGSGVVSAPLLGDYNVDARGGTLELTGALSGGALFEADDNATLIIDQTLPAHSQFSGGGAQLQLRDNATIIASAAVAPGSVQFYGTGSTLDLSGAVGVTIDVTGTVTTSGLPTGTLMGDVIDLLGEPALATDLAGNPDVTLIRESDTTAQIRFNPSNAPGQYDVFDITGNIGKTGLQVVDDGHGGTLIQFGTGDPSAVAVIQPGTSMEVLPDGTFMFTKAVHERGLFDADGSDPSDRLIFSNTASANPDQDTLSGSIDVSGTIGSAFASGSFEDLEAGATTKPGDEDGITVGLSTYGAGLVTGSVNLQFQSVSSAETGSQVRILKDQTVNLSEAVFRTAQAQFLNKIYYIHQTPGQTDKLLHLNVTNNADNDGYSESLIASLQSSTGDFTDDPELTADPSGTTRPIAAGATDSSGISFYADTNPEDFASGRNAVQTGSFVVALISDGTQDMSGGTVFNLGTTDLGTETVNVTVDFTRLAEAYIAKPQVFYVHADPTRGSRYEAITVVNNAPDDGNSENLVATLTALTGFSDPNLNDPTEAITPGSSDDETLGFTVDINSSDFSDARTHVQTGTAQVHLVSDGTGVDGLGTTDLGTVTVPIEVDFYQLAKPVFQTHFSVHASAPTARGNGTQTLYLDPQNEAPANVSDDLRVQITDSSGDFTPLDNADITKGPEGTSSLIVAGIDSVFNLPFQVVTDATALAEDPGLYRQSGVFDTKLTSVSTDFVDEDPDTALPSQNLAVTVDVVGFASPVIEGLKDPIDDNYRPDAGIPLHETITLGSLYLGQYGTHDFSFANIADDPADSLSVSSDQGGRIDDIAPGHARSGGDAGSVIYHGDYVGLNSFTVTFSPTSTDDTQNTPLTPVVVTYVYQVIQPPPPPIIRYSIAWGDVHITSFDGLAYNFQGAGEYVLTRSTQADQTFQVQVRLQPYAGSTTVSVVTQTAMQVGADRVTFDIARPETVLVDGVAQAFDGQYGGKLVLSGGTISGSGGVYAVTWNSGEIDDLDVTTYDINTYITAAGADDGKLQGLLGEANGSAQLTLPDGTQIGQDGDVSQSQLYDIFGNDWRVTQQAGQFNTSLFDYAPGQGTASFTDPSFPARPSALSEIPVQAQTQALAAVVAAGITDPTIAADTALDYALTGSTDLLTGGANTQQQSGATATVTAQVTPTAVTPSVGVYASGFTQTASASGATVVSFTAYLTGPAATDTTVGYQVTAPGAGYLGASRLGGTLPSGNVTIAAGSTTAIFSVSVPQGALGSDPTDTVQVTITSPSGGPVSAPTAQTLLVNANVVAGPPAVPAITLLSNLGTLAASGAATTVSLGRIVQGETPVGVNLQISNAASAPADTLGGMLAGPTGGFFTLSSATTLPAILPGTTYQGLKLAVATATLGSHSGTVTFSPIDQNATGYAAALATQTITVSDTIVAAAQTVLNTTGPIVFGPAHVGDVLPGVTLSIGNAAGVTAAGLDATLSITAGNFAAGGVITNLAGGQTDAATLTVSDVTSAAGAQTGTAVIALASDAGDGQTLAMAPTSIALSASVYRFAAPAIAPVYLHVGDAGAATLTLANIAAADGYSENLAGTVLSSTAGIGVTGTIGEVAAGGSVALALSVDTSHSFIGGVTLDLVSDGTTIDGLGTSELGHAAIGVVVDAHAIAAFDATIAGQLQRIAPGGTIDLGTVMQGAATVSVALDVRNVASGVADMLSGAIAASGDAAFGTAGLSAFAGLGAGQADTAPVVTLSTQQAGRFSETLTLSAIGSNAGGFSEALAPQTVTVTGTVQSATMPCFLAGTRLLTARGEVAVEHLRVGDLMMTVSGAGASFRPVVWIGHGAFDARRHPHPRQILPIRIREGALGPARPHRDLLVSPGHCLLLDDVLIPAERLVNGATIVQDESVRVGRYYHVELATHDVLVSEGVPSESYLDTGNRRDFGGHVRALFPNLSARAQTGACREVVMDGAALTAVKTRLLARAQARGWQVTAAPDLHLIVGGHVIRPWQTGPLSYVFILPAGSADIRLASRVTVAAEMSPESLDRRRLGLAICDKAIDGRRVALDRLATSCGWHDLERGTDRQWRWTDGFAAIADGARRIELTLTHHAPGWLAAS